MGNLIAMVRLTKLNNKTIMINSITKLTLGSLLAFIVMAAVAQAQAADQQPEEPKPQTPAAPKDAVPFGGKLAAVDKTAMTITLEGKESKRTFQITSSTKLAKAGKPATLDDAVVGEQVGGRYRKTADGKFEAISVRFGPKPESGGDKKSDKKDEKPSEQPGQ